MQLKQDLGLDAASEADLALMTEWAEEVDIDDAVAFIHKYFLRPE